MISFKEYIGHLNESDSHLSVHDLAAKHGLVLKKGGKSIEDFPYTKEIGDEFKKHGHELNFNSKKGHFDVSSSDDRDVAKRKEDMERARLSTGFSKDGKRRTQQNVGGGHSVNGLKG